MRVYATFQIMLRDEAPLMPAVIWWVLECRLEIASTTWPYAGTTRDARRLVAPVAGTIELAGTYTGRPSSFANENRAVVSRFRSRRPYRLVPNAYV